MLQDLLNFFNKEQIEKLLLEKFLRYAVIDTQSTEDSTTYPSTAKQWNLINLLVDELKNLHISDVNVDEYGYIVATIPANTLKSIPIIAFIAHVDTAPGASGANVKPQLINNYSGNDIVLPKDNSLVISVAENSDLKQFIGETIITTDGTTLLGSDDKAGVAIIMTLAELLMQNNSAIEHGTIKIVFTPDEEVGAGTKFLQVDKINAQVAYTLDNDGIGVISKETFSADMAIVKVKGKDIHPGKAKNVMINAIKVISDIIDNLPTYIAPEHTDDRQPFLHPYTIEGNVAEANAKILLRDFNTDGLRVLESHIKQAIHIAQEHYHHAEISLEVKASYRNMADDLAKVPHVTEYLYQAVEKTGLQPQWIPIRGGTDGSQLTAKGLPTPNIFVGGYNFHSKTEWLSLLAMRKALETVWNLMQIYQIKN